MWRNFGIGKMKANADTDWIPHPNIITSNVVLGGINFVESEERIDALRRLYGITHVLCVCDELYETKNAIDLNSVFSNIDSVKFKKTVIKDTMIMGNQWETFKECIEFMDETLEGDNVRLFGDHEDVVDMNRSVVYVHCMRGRSRSATVVLAYLMYRFHLPLGKAYTYLKSRRPFIGPHSWLQSQIITLQPVIIAEVSEHNPEFESAPILTSKSLRALGTSRNWHQTHVIHRTQQLIDDGIDEEKLDEEEEKHEAELIKQEYEEVQQKVQNQKGHWIKRFCTTL